METLVHSPRSSLNEVDLLSERDRKQLWEWNGPWPEPVSECAHELVSRRMLSQPESPAISSYDGEYSYAELDVLSKRLAHHLVELGVGPDVIVPLCFEKSALAIVAMMGVMRAGGALVFLDPQHPPSRREDIVGQVRAKVVMASPQCTQLFSFFEGVTLTLSLPFLHELPAHSHAPISKALPNNIMYVVFTSGSTGRPKGCLIEHASFCSGSLRHAEGSELTASSRVAQFASYAFDVSILEIVTGLIAGACICVPDERAFSRGIATLMTEMRVSWAFLTPSLAKLVSPGELPYLKTLILGGEALSSVDIQTWADHVLLVNGYGKHPRIVAS